MAYEQRFYRQYHKSNDLISYSIIQKESDLYIASTNSTEIHATNALTVARLIVEREIASNQDFLTSFEPIHYSRSKKGIVRSMYNAAKACNVGPMASIAGAISESVGKALLKYNEEVIVENGGDLFISSLRERKVLIYAGSSKISMKMAILLPKGTWGVCTSAGKVGPSVSKGKSDAAIVVSHDCALADAAATALGNMIHSAADLESAVNNIYKISGVMGALAICDDNIAAVGEMNLTKP